MLCSKRYDLEGFAEYAHYLRESHAFQSREFDNITFVLKVHSILQRQGIQVPHQDKVSTYISVMSNMRKFMVCVIHRLQYRCPSCTNHKLPIMLTECLGASDLLHQLKI